MARKQIATFLGPNKGLSVLAERCYGLSGVIANAASGSASSVMLDFTTGSYLAEVELYFLSNVDANSNVYVDATLNGESVYQGAWDQEPSGKSSGGPLVRMIIPPNTKFIFKWGSSASKSATLSLSGRIYR